MVERSNKQEVNETTLASFKISQELWQRFQARCIEQDSTTPKVLNQLIINYLEQTDKNNTEKNSQLSPMNLEEILTQKLEEIVEDYLQKNLEHYLSHQVENRLDQLIEQVFERHLKFNINDPVKSEPSAPTSPPEQPQPTLPQRKNDILTLKSAKELGEILGVSAPYITTLNRIGELQQRGWEDSGKRRGKTILYKPID